MKNPNNCRLISMMGVKPNVVIETMKRCEISPENVFICSDNDKAGNEFYQRLTKEYPQIKCVFPDSRYKDWNDMLCGIPKEKEEVGKVTTYGNKTWNDATDNRDKTLVSMNEDTFLKLKNQLDNSGINYFAYAKDSSVVMAVNDKNIAWLKQLSGNKNLPTRKSNVVYIPPQKNIIGNAEYRYIPDKQYISADSDTALKMADIMLSRNVQFSGRIYPNGKATLTVSGADLANVQSIHQAVIDMRKQFSKAEKADEIIGNKAYRDIRQRQFFYSKLTPEQYKTAQPFLDTNAEYSGLIRDNKVIFTVEKEDSANFHRALENAQREVGIINSLKNNGIDDYHMDKLFEVIHRFAAPDIHESLDSFFTPQLDEKQFDKMLSLVNDYLAQSVSERYGEYSGLNAILDFKNEIDRTAELAEFFSEHNFSDEQKIVISEMFSRDSSKNNIEVIDESFTSDEIREYYDILHNQFDLGDATDFLANRIKPELTEKEKAFMNGDIVSFMAKAVLAWDEIEDIGYYFYEDGYINKFAPHDNASYGNGLSETALYDLAHRMQDGEDIRKEIAQALLGNQHNFITSQNNKFTVEYGDDFAVARYCNTERQISYEELGDAFFKLFKNEYDDIVHDRTVEDLRDIFPDISVETADKLINAFDSAAMHGWKNNQVVTNRIKKALYDILGDEENTEKAFASIADMKYNFKVEPKTEKSSIHFGLLGNGITVYDTSRTDNETRDYVTVAHISPEGVVKVYDDSISADDLALIQSQADSAREKFMADWNTLDSASQLQKLYDKADTETMLNIGKEALSTEEKIVKYMPFVFFGEGERPQPENKDLGPVTMRKVGAFYEMYGKNAQIAVDVLKLHLTSKNGEDMVGFPDTVKSEYADKLRYAGYTVLIEESFEINPPKQQEKLMSDISEVAETTPEETINPLTITFSGDSDSLDEIRDKALSLSAACTLITSGLVVDTYENHRDELLSAAHELGLLAEIRGAKNPDISEDDVPLFADADVIEKIEKSENASDNKPFYETPDVQGEQLSLFGDSVPIAPQQQKKEKETYATGLFVGNVNRFSALHDKIIRGTGFENGKFRVQQFYHEKKPTNKEFADFLKNEYGTGGHTGDDEIKFVDHDSKGIFFTLENNEKFKFTWSEVADFTAEIIEKGEYIEPKIEAEKSVIEMTVYDDISDDKTAQMLSEIRQGKIAEISEKTDDKEIVYDARKKNFSNVRLAYNEDSGFHLTVDTDKIKDAVITVFGQNEEAVRDYLDKYADEINLVDIIEQPKNITLHKVQGGFYEIHGKQTELEKLAEVLDMHIVQRNRESLIGFTDNALENVKSALENAGYSVDIEDSGDKIVFEMLGGGRLEFKDNTFTKLAEIDTASGEISYFVDNLSDKDKQHISEKAREFKPKEVEKFDEKSVGDTQKKSNNFTITDNSLGSGGAKSKFRANIEAIKTLKNLEKEDRSATDEEKEVLSKYVGWGGIAQAFDEHNKSWESEYTQLKELLTDKEYSSARASTLDAFYTSPTVIDGIYEALANFGFEGGNVLEPAMGVGNFFGKMPDEMRENSKLYGVEIDDISGRIAKQVYPDADISIQGFEKNNFQNGCFDVAFGNVPFGDLSFTDNVHSTTKLHDYFFAETLDKVKNGGILAFVTSSGTLDKQNESTRKMLAEKSDFIGAIRLPNTAFKKNANTEVTTDIIFLQKNENKNSAEIPDWVHIGQTADGLPINKYFEQNPDMVLGKIVEGNKLYSGRSDGTMCIPLENSDLKEQLKIAVSKLSATISDEKAKDVYAKSTDGKGIKIPSNLRNYSFFEHDNKIYFKTNNVACHCRFDTKNSQFKRAKAFIQLRDLTRELIEAQELNKSDDVIKNLQTKLNTAYDDFYKKYGLIHSQSNKRYFSDDVSYNLVAGLEKKYEKNKLIEKSDIFTKRTIQPPKAVDQVETAMEALTLSVAEKAKVDFDYMSCLTGMTEDELKHDLQGEIYKVPHTENTYQTASEYLSGDIRAKLKIAEEIAEYDGDFAVNVNALKQAVPTPLKAGDIDVKLGATWIDPKYYEQFMYETFQTPRDNRADVKHFAWQRPKLITAEYSEHSGNWHIDNKSQDRSVITTQQFGSREMNAYDIMEHLLNLKEPKIYKTIEVPDGMGDVKEKRVVDIDATRVVQKKADKIKAEFKKWIFKDPARREEIVDKYNELFNSIRPREFDGSALKFPMMNADITLHEHQKNAIAHAMFGGNTLFAHCVGAGKTFEMIATAMESKRLGLCTKSLFAVPNHLTEQIGDDFQKLYPGANILVATKKDFQKENRQQLFAKIATGNFDAVIIGHSQLGMIPISKERQEMELQSQISDIIEGIAELKAQEGSKFQVKAMERTKKSLEKQLDKLEKNHDDTITFEQLGVDKLFVDEAHEFKNLFCPTKLTNVSGISNSASQKALDLYLKCRYLDEKTDGKGVVMATGTPLSNSVTELHTMMRYLEYDFLKSKNLQHFDNWVTVFGEQKTDWELAPAGNKFKERTRIANYTGMPELMSMFKQIADIRTADTLKLDVPECEYKIINVEATDFQKQLVDELADRADAINAGNVEPTIDNMLKITSDGRKLGLDPRLIDPSFEDNPNTKLNQCVENVVRIHLETEEDKLTQIIFCDLGVPHKNSNDSEKADGETVNDEKFAAEKDSLEEECDFCVYDDIKSKLISKSIPENEIAYIHDAKTEKQKSELFDKVRNGEIRVLLGSTAKMGTGTNVQKKLIAVHDLDIPWRPADLEQRAGRIIRQGNENKNVAIYRYVTKGTFDAYSYQTLENKQKFISQIMTSKEPARRCEDVDQQALTYSEIKALCTGDERIKEKLMLDNDVKELKALEAEYQNTVYEMEDTIKAFPERESRLNTALENLRSDREHLRKLSIDAETKLPEFKITIGDVEYTDKKEAAKAFEDAVLSIKQADVPVKIGEFQ